MRAGGLLAAQATGDAIEHRSVIESAGGNIGLELRAEVDQMPAQAVDLTGALGNEIGAMIGASSRISSARSSRNAAGKRSTPSLTTARATALASI